MRRLRAILFMLAARWWAEREMDQWEDWVVDTKHGRVYIDMRREQKG